ncbi:putative Tau-tubulin kinase [Blattamonas nauphoetae]|uniref:non-specific serine/threonine protein kinase n=1 Tax=Blattamonas nauphoetae TaxID=2049346 RepID=A0ABQ9XQS7_9EUKA|nr:putative Tau-tubulin kinase [Blattamonas nauphoetae]
MNDVIMMSSDPTDVLVLEKSIGKGGFGMVSKCTWRGLELAMKRDNKKHRSCSLKTEADVLCELQGMPHFPVMYQSGMIDSTYFITMELLGKNLRSISARTPSGCLSDTSVAYIGLQAVEAIELLHSKGFVHRDIKPRNFVVGRGKQADTLYLIDFGLAKKFNHFTQSSKRSGGHGFRGTVRYASIAAHKGYRLCAVDDLWSLLYSLVQLTKGELPWGKIKDKKIVYRSKLAHHNHTLVEGMPAAYTAIVDSLRHTRHTSLPDYAHLKALFLSILSNTPTPNQLSSPALAPSHPLSPSPSPTPSLTSTHPTSPTVKPQPIHTFGTDPIRVVLEWGSRMEVDIVPDAVMNNSTVILADHNFQKLRHHARQNSPHSRRSTRTPAENVLDVTENEGEHTEYVFEGDKENHLSTTTLNPPSSRSSRRRKEKPSTALREMGKVSESEDESVEMSTAERGGHSTDYHRPHSHHRHSKSDSERKKEREEDTSVKSSEIPKTRSTSKLGPLQQPQQVEQMAEIEKTTPSLDPPDTKEEEKEERVEENGKTAEKECGCVLY